MRTRHARVIRRGILAARLGHPVGGPIRWRPILITTHERDAYHRERFNQVMRAARIRFRARRPARHP